MLDFLEGKLLFLVSLAISIHLISLFTGECTCDGDTHTSGCASHHLHRGFEGKAVQVLHLILCNSLYLVP